MAAKRSKTCKRPSRARAVAPEPQEMRMVRLRVGSSFPLHPEDIGIAIVPGRTAKVLLDTGQAVPVCGTNRDVQIASLCTAAEALAVTLTTSDPEIGEAAVRYGARCEVKGAKTPKGVQAPGGAVETPKGVQAPGGAVETPKGVQAPGGAVETPGGHPGATAPDGSKTG